MSRPHPRRRVWIDTDPAVGIPGCDVDDGYALVQALHSPELEVVGISTVFGNAPLDVAHDVATELISVAEVEVPLHRGAASAEDLGRHSPASEALAGALSDGPLSVLALGPLTNLATTVQSRPESVGNLSEVVAVAGRRPGQRFLVAGRGPLPDFNFECDPRAAEALLAATAVPVTLAGFEAATHALVTPAHVARLRRGPPAARWLAERTASWLDLWAEHFSTAGFHPFDTLAVGALVAPSLLCTEPMQAAVVHVAVTEPDHRGHEGPPLQLHAAPSLPAGRPVRYASTVEPGFVDDLMARLLDA